MDTFFLSHHLLIPAPIANPPSKITTTSLSPDNIPKLRKVDPPKEQWNQQWEIRQLQVEVAVLLLNELPVLAPVKEFVALLAKMRAAKGGGD